MNGAFKLVRGFAACALLVQSVRADDWRKDLLTEEGIGLSKEALEGALKNGGDDQSGFEGVYRRLGSESFEEREKAQKEFLAGGEKALRWLRKHDTSDDPEVQRRAERIMALLKSSHGNVRGWAVEHSLRTLLAEGAAPGSDTGGVFYEWFGQDVKKLGKGYRGFVFEDLVGRGGKVENGRLSLPGGQANDGDQRLVLKSKEWPGEESFGESFEVSAMLGGESKSPAAWHLGISIGNVRALFHPGLEGGAFRFENTTDRKYLSRTVNVGFTPGEEFLQSMSINVTRLPDDRVQLKVVLVDGAPGKTRFESEIAVGADEIGKLDKISLDRSGRTGGTAFFQDFVIKKGE